MTSAESDVHFVQDPFGPATNPQAYVPRVATERVLREIEASLAAGRIPALVGPPGLGKSLLIRRVGQEQPLLRSLYVPFCALPIDELCSFTLQLLGTAAGGDAVEALLGHARALGREGSGILLLIDDAGAMPVEAARELADLAARSEGALRIALAAVEGDPAQQVCAAFGAAIDTIALDEALDEEEARAYVATRLAFAEADGRLCAAFDSETVARLFRASQGIPRRLNLAAQSVMRDALGDLPPGVGAGAREADPSGAAAPAAPVSGIAALLEQESDVWAIVEALRKTHAPRPARKSIQAPQDETARAASDSAVARAPARETPASATTRAADTEPPVDAPEIPESRIGTYRLLRSASQAEPRLEPVEPDAPGTARRETGGSPSARDATRVDPEIAKRRARRRRRAMEALHGVLRGLLVAIGGAASIAAGAALLWFAQKYITTLPTRAASAPAAGERSAPGARTPASATQAPEPVSTLAKPPIVRVAIDATPRSVIAVDGVEIGETPLAGIGIPEGRHVFRARTPDGGVREREIEIDAAHRRVVFE